MAQLVHERTVLATFTGDSAASRALPTLHPDCPPVVSVLAPYIAMVPVGTSLCHLAESLSATRRAELVPQLVSDLRDGLSAAHRLGYCHSDLHPGNVIYAENRFVMIDWGLARREGVALHHHRGSALFFAAAVLQAIIRSESSTSSNDYPAIIPYSREAIIPYHSDHDLESTKYVAIRLEPLRWTDLSDSTLLGARVDDLNEAGIEELRL